MKYGTIVIACGFASASLAMSGPAGASGFMVRDHSTAAMATSYAGATAGGSDPSFQVYNPAMLTDLDGLQTTLDFKGFFPSAKISTTSATAPGALGGGDISGLGDSGEMAAAAFAPTGFASWKPHDRFAVGFGVYSPFASKIETASSWAGQYQLLANTMTTYDVQLSAAYKVHDWLSVGASLNLQYFEGDWKRMEVFEFPAANYFAVPGFLNGNDIGFGATLGAILTPSDMTRIGLSYRTAIDHSLSGNAGVAGYWSEGATTRLTTPDSLTLGVQQMLNDRWTLLADAGWTGWSKFKGLDITLAVNGAQTRAQDWHDTWHASFGARYKVSDTLSVSGGVLFDQAAPNSTDNALSPDGDRIQIGFGIEKQVTEKTHIAAAISHQMIADSSISILETSGARAGTSFNGTMRTHVTAAGVSITTEW